MVERLRGGGGGGWELRLNVFWDNKWIFEYYTNNYRFTFKHLKDACKNRINNYIEFAFFAEGKELTFEDNKELGDIMGAFENKEIHLYDKNSMNYRALNIVDEFFVVKQKSNGEWKWDDKIAEILQIRKAENVLMTLYS